MNPTQVSLPELIALREGAQGLRLAARRIRTRLAGQYLAPAKGRGMEFAESRPYQPGDDVRSIDWRVTARRGDTHTKLFREERERPVLISVDRRVGMAFATRGRFKSVQAAELAATLAWAALNQGDRVGGELFWEDGHQEFRPTRGKHSLLCLLQGLVAPLPNTQPAPASLEAPFKRLRQLAHAGSLVVVISDFRGLDASAEAQLLQIARHSEILLAQVYDPLERELPDSGWFGLTDGARQAGFSGTDSAFSQSYQQQAKHRFEALAELASRYRLGLLQLATDQPILPELTRLYGKGAKPR